MTERTEVDVLSLEDFRGTFKARISEINGVLSKLENKLACRPPALGTFTDAMSTSRQYTARYQQYVQRATRLKEALVAARDATDAIISEYQTTEERNRANAADIAGALGGVGDALAGEGQR